MLLLLAASLLASQPAAPDTLPPQAAVPAGAYLDAGARETVRLARERRAGVESGIRGYRALSRSRVSLGIRALRRDRLFYRCESAVRVDWRRGEPALVEVLGGREVLPAVSARPEPEDDCGSSAFDPTEDRLNIGLGGMFGGEKAFIRHPLAPGSEAHYRYRSGDTTTVTLPNGPTLRVVELEVIPRRSASELVSGSLWLEGDSHAVVRAVFRLARPFDLERDAARVDDGPDLDDVPGILKPIRADLRYITVEYGLWDQRWWLPRLVAFEGEAEVGRMARFPLRMEQVYSEFVVEGDPPGTPVAAREPQGVRECRGGSERAKALRDSLQASTAAFRVEAGCRCSGGRCIEAVTLVPRDSTRLLASEHLPPTIFEEGDVLMSEREMEELIGLAKGAAPAPWQLGRPRIAWGPGAPGMLRYNRVEGLSVGARAEWDLGRATADAALRLGLADLEPEVVLGLARTGPASRHRLAAYRRLNEVEFTPRALGLGNSLSALFLGRDDGYYYRSLGAELSRDPAAGSEGVSWRVFAERQTAAEVSTDFTLADLWGEGSFRENIHAAEAGQVGGSLTWRTALGLDPTGWRGGAGFALEASTGTYSFARPRGWLFGTAPLPAGLLGAVEVAAGTSAGEVPVQSLWYLGGPGTVRGYRGGEVAGEAFWRGRAEVGTAAPGARLLVFSDAGWAGARDSLRLDPTLLSAGVGASFLDGLVRLDLARALREPTGWRVSLYLDAVM